MFRVVRIVTAVVSLAVGLASCSAVGGGVDALAPATSVADVGAITTGLTVGQLTAAKIKLPTSLRYLQQGYNELPEWRRVDLATAPDGTAWAAWPAANGVHVTPLTAGLTRRGADTVIPGTSEVSGLVAFDNGFTLLTRVPDSNKWHETAAALISYRGGKRAFETRLTGTASHDTAPVLDGALAWNGKEYGAYFVIHGAGGFADGHFGDKLVYLSAAGKIRAAARPGAAATTRASRSPPARTATSRRCAGMTGGQASSSPPASAHPTTPPSSSVSSAGPATAAARSRRTPATS